MSQLDFGIIGNCQISALVDRTGKVNWCCMPRFDAPALFASLLDTERGGFWSIEPAVPEGGQKTWETRQYYMRNTNVLVTQFSVEDGTQFEVIDFVPRFQKGDVYYKPPQIVRVVRPFEGHSQNSCEVPASF